MNQVVLINGTYGVGKTTVANLIIQNEELSFVLLDPDKRYNELINKGWVFRLGWPMQQSKPYLNELKNRIDAAAQDHKVVIPMTISTELCKNELFDYLDDNFDLIHIILYARKDVVIDRIENQTGRSKEFSLEKLDENIHFFEKNFKNAIWIDTSEKSSEKVAGQIISLL